MVAECDPRLALSDAEHVFPGIDLFTIKFPHNKKPFEMTYFTVEPSCQTPVDQHEVLECWLILQGQGELNYNGKVYLAHEKDIFYFETCQPHSIKNISNKPLLICSIYWKQNA